MTPHPNTTLTTGSTTQEDETPGYPTRAAKRSRNNETGDSASRFTDNSTSRSKRQSSLKEEQKTTRPKPPLSCGECRRLKLKCDRVFPCQSCVKRGCGGICPEGSLTSGRGSRYILANTEQLHEKILQMADRIRDLEDALQSLHSEHYRCRRGPSSNVPSHPLLRGKHLLVKTQLELYGIDPSRLTAKPSGPRSESSSEELTDIDVSDDSAPANLHNSNSASARSQLGHTPFDEDSQSSSEIDASIQGVWSSFDSIRLGHESVDGRGADADIVTAEGTRNLFGNETGSITQLTHSTSGNIIPDELPEELKNLSASFPLAWSIGNVTYNAPTESTAVNLVQRIRAFLPPKDDAIVLCRIVRENILWQLNCIASEKNTMLLISEVYNTLPADLNPRKLSLLLMLLVIGKNTEATWTPQTSQDSNSSNEDLSTVDSKAKRTRAGLTMKAYHQLARASLCAIPITSQPDLYTVQTLFLMTWFLLVISDDKQAGFAAWGVMGITAKLAQALGLHREPVGSVESQQEHRLLFWELLHLDARMSLAIGRPPSFSSTYRDCKRPICTGPDSIIDNHLEASYYDFKFAFYDDCLSKVTEYSLCTLAPNYTAVLKLDRKIRDYEIPIALTEVAKLRELNNTNLPENIVKLHAFQVKQWKDSAILQLHRTPYTHAFTAHKSTDSREQSSVDIDSMPVNSEDQWDSLLCGPYAPSVLATFISACRIIEDLEKVYECASEISPYYAIFWFNGFCGALALCLVASRIPASPLTPFALRKLVRAVEVFGAASGKSAKVARSSIILQGLVSKCISARKLWEASRDQSASCNSNIDVTCKNKLKSLADYIRSIPQGGNHCPSGGCTTPKTGSTSLPNHCDVWGKAHPEIIQLLAKLLSLEDDQGGSAQPTIGYRDVATTVDRYYAPAQRVGGDISHWDTVEETRHFNAHDFQTTHLANLPSADRNYDTSHIPINFPVLAFNSPTPYPPTVPVTHQDMDVVDAGEYWYANITAPSHEQFQEYNIGGDTYNLLAYNHALSNLLPSSDYAVPPSIPVDAGTLQSHIRMPHSVFNGYDNSDGTSHFQNMNFGIGTFASQPPSEQYQYHDNTTSENGW